MAEPRTQRAIADDYQAARRAGDGTVMRRLQNEEACIVLLTVLERLAADEASFIREVALKGGILMAGELRSPRASADIDATTGRQRRMDPDRIVADLRRAGREFGIRQEGDVDRTPGGTVVHLRFDSLTDAGTAKLEVSVREDLVFAVRDATFDVVELGLQPGRDGGSIRPTCALPSTPSSRSPATGGGGRSCGARTSRRSGSCTRPRWPTG